MTWRDSTTRHIGFTTGGTPTNGQFTLGLAAVLLFGVGQPLHGQGEAKEEPGIELGSESPQDVLIYRR